MNLKIYPGMLDARIEYFQKDDRVFKIEGGKIKSFEDSASHSELERILQTETTTDVVLTMMCGNNETEKLRTLAKCRFGGLNFEADFDENGNHCHDFIDCPLRATCPGNGIVCKSPEINGQTLTELELSILRRCVSDRKNSAIAHDLNMPEGTFNVQKNKVYKKTGIPTKQHLAITLFAKGLL